MSQPAVVPVLGVHLHTHSFLITHALSPCGPKLSFSASSAYNDSIETLDCNRLYTLAKAARCSTSVSGRQSLAAPLASMLVQRLNPFTGESEWVVVEEPGKSVEGL